MKKIASWLKKLFLLGKKSDFGLYDKFFYSYDKKILKMS